MATITKKAKQPRKQVKKSKFFVETSFLTCNNGPMIDVLKGDIDVHVKKLEGMRVPLLRRHTVEGKKHYVLGNAKFGYVVYTEI